MPFVAKDPLTWIPKENFLEYTGEENSGRIAKFYDKAASQKNLMAFSLNWVAILIFPAWLGYRKQWRWLLFYTGFFSVLPFFEGRFHFSVPNAAFLAAGIFLGTRSDGMMLGAANQTYHQLKDEGLEDPLISEKMRAQAKGSVGLAIAALLACLGVTFAFNYLAAILFLAE